jgi:2-keto-4-pentenoate hydratase
VGAQLRYDNSVSTAPTPGDAAQILIEARISKFRIPELPVSARPTVEVDAYGAQRNLVERLLRHYGGEVIGYKIACTNALAQRQLSVTGPFYGHLLSPFCYNSPAQLDSAQFDMRLIEAEFAFRIGRDLPPVDSPRSREEIADAIDGLLPGIELVDSRYDSWTTVGVLSLISDNACNAGWVRGTLIQDWKRFYLASQAVRLYVNDQLKQEGNGAAVLGHPLNALQWLVEKLNSHGLGLKAGQFVTTGVTTGVYEAVQGDSIRADFGDVGQVEVRFK